MAIKFGHQDATHTLISYYEENVLYENIFNLVDKFSIDYSKHNKWIIMFKHMNNTKYMKNDTCPICYNEKKTYVFSCLKHYYCINCHMEINKCAFCRAPKMNLDIMKLLDDDK